MEVFAKPAVGAIIEKTEENVRYLLIQTRNKEGGGIENGLTELPAGKIREYENVFDALRREVREETGLTLTYIQGEAEAVCEKNDYQTLSFQPFCTTQNLSGGYSIILHSFLCRAEGTPLAKTDETTAIRWERAEHVRQMLLDKPQAFYLMHVNALQKYFSECFQP